MAYINTPRHIKYRKITDYIPSAARTGPDEEELDIGNNIKIVTSARKNGLESVSSAQWVAANACILAEIMQDPHLSLAEKVQTAVDYQAYTAKIGVLASTHIWKSVLLWDDEYRRVQHVHKFRWGSESPHLNLVRLVHRETDQQKKQKPKTRSGENTTRAACFNWNKGTSCRFTPCKFKHECSVCGSATHTNGHHEGSALVPSQGALKQD